MMVWLVHSIAWYAISSQRNPTRASERCLSQRTRPKIDDLRDWYNQSEESRHMTNLSFAYSDHTPFEFAAFSFSRLERRSVSGQMNLLQTTWSLNRDRRSEATVVDGSIKREVDDKSMGHKAPCGQSW